MSRSRRSMSISIALSKRLLLTTSDIHEEAEKGNIQEVMRLIDKGVDINKPDKFGMTPLMFAAREGHFETLISLLSRGANVSIKALVGSSALHLAADNGNFEIAAVLLDRGASANDRDDLGRSGLHRACLKGHLDVTRLFIERKFDINAMTNKGNTPISLAAENGHYDIVKFLLSKGARVDNVSDNAGWTPLHRAVSARNTDIVRLLMESGADVNSQNIVGSSPLHIAVMDADEHDLEIVDLLLSYGASPTRRTIDHKRPGDFTDCIQVKEFISKTKYKVPSLTRICVRSVRKHGFHAKLNLLEDLPHVVREMVLHPPA